MFLNKFFWQKFVSSMLIFSVFVSINAPIVHAEGFFDFGDQTKEVSKLPSISREKLVAILVQEDLLNNSLKEKITRYARDVQNELSARSILIPVPASASPFEIQEGLAQFYFSGYNNDNLSQLIGTVLIGDVPLPIIDKNGGLHPTIFPYVDFENVNYEWNYDSGRFQWVGGDEEPEIWHGLIRSDADTFDARIFELEGYFERNHQVHIKNTNYSKKVFFADLYLQRDGISEKQKSFYENWINYLGDFEYLKFNKHWLQKLIEKEIEDDLVPNELLPPSMQGQSQKMDFSQMPDVFAKYPIETMATNYLSANENILTQVNEQIEPAGRWDSIDIETTISLVAKKDEWATKILKSANDEIEDIFIAKSRENNVASNISISKDLDVVYNCDVLGFICNHKYFPNNWLGVPINNDFANWNWRTQNYDNPPKNPAENCSLYRGSVRSESDPLSQKVEISRIFNPYGFDDTPSDRCNGKASGAGIDYSRCRFSEYISDMYSNNSGVINDDWDMVGGWSNKVTSPVFNFAGSREVFENKYDGASGCAPVILELRDEPDDAEIETEVGSNKISFSSFMVHNEPTKETIRAMMEKTTANAMPVDKYHGISFYDQSYVFHKINFPSAFDLINKRDELDSDFDLLTKSELEQSLVSTINTINLTAGNSGKIQETFFADSYWMDTSKQNDLIEAIKWLGSDLEKKNVEMLTGALSRINKGRNILKQNDYNGYEVVEIRGELAELNSNSGIKIAFERGLEDPSNTFINAQNESNFNEYDLEVFNNEDSRASSIENLKLQQEFEEIFAENETSDECSGQNIITWPTKCLIPWVADLPNVFKKITKLESSIDPEEVENNNENSAKKGGDSFSLLDGNVDVNDVLSAITVSPNNIKIANGESFPQDITVSLKNQDGEIMVNDYETEIEIIPDNSDANKFFSLLPSNKIIAEKGQALFHLLPKESAFGGTVNFKFKAQSKTSDVLSIQILNNKISAFVDDGEIEAGSTAGTIVTVKILDKDGNINHSFDGEVMTFDSEEGDFYSDDFTGSRSKINNGVAKILFLPGIKSGKAIISVQDEESVLPPEQVYIDITPAVPHKIVLNDVQDKLVENGAALQYSAEITDKYGNIIPNLSSNITWQTEGDIALEKEENGDVFLVHEEKEASLLKNIGEILNKNSADSRSSKITLEATVFDSEGSEVNLSESREISLTKNPYFEISIPDNELIAGSLEPLIVKVIAKNESGDMLKNNFKAQVIPDNILVGKIGKEVVFENGEAELEIFAGNKSGNLNIQVLANGFVQNFFSVEVLADTPYKITLISDDKNLNADSNEPLDLNINVLDKHGNIANFNDDIYFEINPSESFENTAQEIKDLGIFSNPATADEFAKNRQLEISENAESKSISLENETLKVSLGQGINKVTPLGVGGKTYILATAEGLLPGTIELDVTKILTTRDFKFLSPKSLLTMLLGFSGGDLNKPSIGNRFLFDGETQAVATQIVPLTPNKILGNIFADGGFSESILPQISSGNKLTVLLNNLATAKIQYNNSPKFFAGKKEVKNEGIYFNPLSKLNINDFSLESRAISYKKSPLFTVTKNGGIIFKNSEIIFQSIENSLLNWEVYLGEVLIGQMYFKINDVEIIASQENDNFAGNSILIESLNENVSIQKAFNGKTTTEEQGINIVSKNEQEEGNKTLGSSNFDETSEELGWTSDWKVGTIFAGKNSIGNSAKWSSSDSFILLGDPTLSVHTQNEKSDLNLTKDLGEPIWKSPVGVIDDIVTGDLNYDNKSEVFIRSGNNLTALYQDEHNSDNFRDIGKILRFGDGAKKIVSYNRNNGDLVYIIQINDDGELIFHHNINGKFSREKIDLGINNPIENIAVARLNSDNFDDLILLDNSNNLYYAYGKNDRFYSAQILDSHAASFENISEKYVRSDGQSVYKDIVNANKFSNLNNFFAGFNDSANYSWSGNSQKIHNLDFLSVTDNKAFDITFETEIDNSNQLDLKVKNDTKFTQRITVYSPEENLTNFQLIVPDFAGFEIDYDSLSVANCGGVPNIKKENSSFMITGCDISSNTFVTYSWNMKAKEVPLINFVVEDFEGKDGIDDIVIPWEIDGKKKFIQYLSYGNGKLFPPQSAQETGDSPSSPITKTHRKSIVDAFPNGTKFPTDFDAESSAEDMFECLKESQNDGLPDFYNTPSVEESLANISTNQNLAGLQIPSIAFLAPGPQSIYIPPFSFPNPLPTLGKPVFWVSPLPPFVGSMAGQYPASVFRLYLMPTTTLRLGIGICGGPIIDPTMTATGSPFPPQCFVIVPPLSASASSSGNGNDGNNVGDNENGSGSNNCQFENPANSSDVNVSKNNFLLNSFANTGNAFNLGSFSLKVGNYSKNKEIKSPDIITEWVKAQMKEFSNYKFPRFDIILPQFEKSENENDDLKPLEKLSQSPYFEIKKEKLEINYPSFSKKDLEKVEISSKSWKDNLKKEKEKLKRSILKIDQLNFEELKEKIEKELIRTKQETIDKLSTEIEEVEEKIEKVEKFVIEKKAELSVEKSKLEKNLSEIDDIDKKEEIKNKIKDNKIISELLIKFENSYVEIKYSVKSEIEKIKNDLSKLDNIINKKIEETENLPKKIKEAVNEKIQNQLDELEKLEEVVVINIKSLKSYDEEIKKMKELPVKIEDIAVKEINKMNLIIKEYWTVWMKKNEKAAQEWKEFEKKTTAVLKTWKEVPNLFKDFTTSCTPGGGGGSTSVNRGTLLTWVTKILLSAINLPVIPMPQYPDTEIDLSKVKIGASLAIPEISFRPVKLNISTLLPQINLKLEVLTILESSLDRILKSFSLNIKGLPDFSIDDSNLTIPALEDLIINIDSLLIGLGSISDTLSPIFTLLEKDYIEEFANIIPEINIPTIPELPMIPSIVPEVKIPPINLPQLPTLLPPPEFPNLLKPVQTIISVIKPIVNNILCLLSMGIIPIPEWKVASRVVQQTNRTGLSLMDFVPSAQLPTIPKIPLPTIEISPEIDLVPAFDTLNVQIKSMAQTMNSLTDMMSSAGKGGLPSVDNLIPSGPPFSLANPSKDLIEAEKLVTVDIYDQVGEVGEIDTSKILARFREMSNSSDTINLDINQNKEKSDLEKKLASYKGLLADNRVISSNNTPNYLPEGFDTSDYDLANSEPVPVGKLYYYSSLEEKAESITNFPVSGVSYNLNIADLDEDGEDEILYSINGQLFMKRLFVKNLNENEELLTYSVPNDLLYKNFAEFSDYFSPTLDYYSEINSSENIFEFLPVEKNNASYFEWIISDRPDRMFEEGAESNKKSSEEWERIGFLIRPKGYKYEIRQGVAQIKKVNGNPIIYGNALAEVEKMSKDDCENDEIVKPFFTEETILVGIDAESKFKVRTKKRAGQQEGERDIILREGEETVVDFAEICLTKGAIKHIDLDKIEKFTPTEGDHFFSNMRLELGINDGVELSLFNNTDVNIYGGEKYELYSFNSRDEYINHIKTLSIGNHYGQFIGFGNNKKSFTYSKEFLHDPQFGDDEIAPKIIISQGDKISAFITKPIKIDASPSYDNQKISRVWWEQDAKIFLDSNSDKYSPTEALKIQLPAKSVPQNFSVTLNISDESGNVSRKSIPVAVKVPSLKMLDVSMRDGKITGKVEEGISGIEIGFLRERNGNNDFIERTISSEENGSFSINNLSTFGNVLLKNNDTDELITEILPTGRSVIIGNNAKNKINKNPFAVEIKNNAAENLATINFRAETENDIGFDTFSKEISIESVKETNEIAIVDANDQDNFTWKSFSGGFSLIDNLNNKTIGVLNNSGLFTTTGYLQDLAIKPKDAQSESDPLIFQIYGKNSVIAEFFIPVKELIVQ